MKKNSNVMRGVLIGLTALLIGTGIYFAIRSIGQYLSVSDLVSGNTIPYTLTEEELAKHPYIKDVKFTGPVKYMELFDYKFQKSGMYKRNKDFDPDKINIAAVADASKAFLETLYTVDYHDLLNGSDNYMKTLEPYLSENTMFFSDAGPLQTEEDGIDVFIEELATKYVQDGINSKATFITDPELCYYDGYFFCRGVIEYETFGENSSKGIMCYPVEVAVTQNFDDENAHIAGIFPIEDQDTKEIYKDFKLEQ